MNLFSNNKLAANRAEQRFHWTGTSGSRGYILITGATGLVGQYLLADLFAKNQKLAVLVRAKGRGTAPNRIEEIMQRWERLLQRPLPRPIVLPGDLSGPDLGLSEAHQSWVRQYCDRLIHNAAVLNFHSASRDSEPWLTNLQGTRHVLSFAEWAQIPELHYVSTAYVSGLCSRVYYEDDFDLGQEFRNDYERSKFQAEQSVRQAQSFKSKTIYRPAVIVGDSRNGYTASYHGLYVYLRLMATLIPQQEKDSRGRLQTPIRLPMTGDEPRNLVPVNWVSRVISEIVCNPAAHNRTFHLVPEQGLTARELIDHCYDYFGSTGAQFGIGESAQDNENAFARSYLENVQVYSPYDTSDPSFDNHNLKAYGPGLECPIIDRDVVFRFLDFGIVDQWGKRKHPQPQVTCWLQQQWPHLTMAWDRERSLLAELELEPKLDLALDVWGPGGGQWQLSLDRHHKLVCRPGIPVNVKMNLRFCTGDFDESVLQADEIQTWRSILRTAVSEMSGSMQRSA